MKRKRPDGSFYLSMKSPKMKRKRPDDSFYLFLNEMNQKSPDAEIPSPKMEQKSKPFEPSLTYARDAEILSRKMKGKRPDAAIRYSTLCRGVVQYLTDEFTVRKNKAEKVVTAVSNLARSDRGQTSTPEIINLEKSPDAEIPSPKMERRSKSFEPSLTCARDAGSCLEK